MTDITKSKVLRVILCVAIIAVVMIGTLLLDTLFDALPIWFTPEPNHMIEKTVFFFVVLKRVWAWLSARVWIGTVAPGQDGTP